MTSDPVFIVGASRSGTAMLRSMLNNSDELHIAGETHYFDDLRTLLQPGPTQELAPDQRDTAEDYFLALADRPYGHGGSAARSRLDRDDLRRRAHELGGSGDAYFQAFCELHAQLEDRPVVARWGEKTPRHILRLPEILEAYPSSRVIAMVRDPRAVAASYSNWSNQGGLGADGDYARALDSEAARAAASYDPVVSTLVWRGGVRTARAARDRHGPSRVRLQHYEDLVTDAAGQLDEIGTFLDIRTDDAMLDVPMHNSSFARFDSEAGVSEGPLTRWKSVLDDRQVAIIQTWARQEMASEGYQPEPVALGTTERVSALALAGLGAVRAVIANRDRSGSLPGYVLRRAKAAFSR